MRNQTGSCVGDATDVCRRLVPFQLFVPPCPPQTNALLAYKINVVFCSKSWNGTSGRPALAECRMLKVANGSWQSQEN